MILYKPGRVGEIPFLKLQRHEHLVRHVVFAPDAKARGRSETEPRIVFRVAEDHNRTKAIRETKIEAFPDKSGTDQPALVIGEHGHRPESEDLQSGSLLVGNGSKDDVSAYNAFFGFLHKREIWVCTLAKKIDQICLGVRIKSGLVDNADRSLFILVFPSYNTHLIDGPERSFLLSQVPIGRMPGNYSLPSGRSFPSSSCSSFFSSFSGRRGVSA